MTPPSTFFCFSLFSTITSYAIARSSSGQWPESYIFPLPKTTFVSGSKTDRDHHRGSCLFHSFFPCFLMAQSFSALLPSVFSQKAVLRCFFLLGKLLVKFQPLESGRTLLQSRTSRPNMSLEICKIQLLINLSDEIL